MHNYRIYRYVANKKLYLQVGQKKWGVEKATAQHFTDLSRAIFAKGGLKEVFYERVTIK